MEEPRRVLDISVTIGPGMPVYAGDPEVQCSLSSSIDRGDPANITLLELGAHTGTHVDAPRHFIPDTEGAAELPLEPFVGPCVVAEAHPGSRWLDGELVRSLELPPRTERLLLKTPNSALWERDEFDPNFVSFNEEGAKALIDRGVRLVGIDYLSIGDPGAHVALLGSRIAVLEGLDLRAVDPGRYFLACLPLKIAGSDGAPARAVLFPLEP